MTVLLDTHAFVWALTAPDRLSAAAREAISDATTPLLLSAASAWEMSIKHRSGRWPEVAILLRQYDRVASRLGVTRLAITTEHALAAGGFDWEHADPFDRVLAAQAMAEGVPLVSRDKAFRELPGLRVLW